MKLPGEEETGGGVGPSLIYMVIGVSAFVLIVLFAVFRSNDNKRGGSEYLQQVQEQKEEEVKQEDIRAKYESGVLKLAIPKPEEKKPQVEEKKYIAIEG